MRYEPLVVSVVDILDGRQSSDQDQSLGPQWTSSEAGRSALDQAVKFFGVWISQSAGLITCSCAGTDHSGDAVERLMICNYEVQGFIY